MDRIQKLFELIAGITEEERNRRVLTNEVYGAPCVDVVALRTPACWRRKSNVQGIKRHSNAV